MAWQLIYTSAPRGLVAGRSGFCTVARHREIRDALVTAIERVSQYERSSRSSIGPAIHPVIYSHRIIAVGSSVYHVLSRIRDAGADYTGRTNHIAHHLICEQHEISAAPSPADILLQMPWRDTAPETPRFFTDTDVIKLSHFHTSLKLPAENWRQLTGDAGCAALPLEGGALGGCYWIHQPESDQRQLLNLFAESLLLLNPRGNTREKLWQFPFTTYFQSSDGPADFLWRGCWPEGQAMLSATRGSKQLIDLTQARLLAAPQNSIAEFARTGRATLDAPSIFAQVPEFEDGAALPVDAIGAPAPSAAVGEELDIESLIAKADERHQSKQVSTKPKYFFLIGLAVLLALGLAFLGYQGWRRETARNAIKLAAEEEIFRLKGIEERPARAAARVYRTSLEKAPYWSQIKDHAEIKKRIEALDQWEESEKQLDDIEKDSGSPQLRDLALDKIKKLDSALDALPPGYKRVVDARRQKIRGRIEAESRLAHLDAGAGRPAPADGAPPPAENAPRPAEMGKEAPPAQAPEKVAANKPVLTYIAFATAQGFQISAVQEMAGGQRFPETPRWEVAIFYKPAPLLDSEATGNRCTINNNNKIYDKDSRPILTLRDQMLVLGDNNTRRALGLDASFTVRFTNPDARSECFQILFIQTGDLITAPFQEAMHGSLSRKGPNTIALAPELMKKLQPWRLAASEKRGLFLESGGLKGQLLEVGEAGEIDLGPVIKAEEDKLRKLKAAVPGPNKREDPVRAAGAARDILLGKEDKIGFSALGEKVLGDEATKGKAIRTYQSRLKEPINGLASGEIKPPTARSFVEYTREILNEHRKQLDDKLADVNQMLMKIEADLPSARGQQQKGLEANREDQLKKKGHLEKKIAVVNDVVDKLDKHLKFPGFSGQRADESISIWTADPLKTTIPAWGSMFTADNIAKIRPFLWWKEDDNLDQQLAKLEKVPVTPKPQPELIEKKLATLKGDLEGLGPFQLVVKSPTSEASMPLVKINVPAPKAEEAPAPK